MRLDPDSRRATTATTTVRRTASALALAIASSMRLAQPLAAQEPSRDAPTVVPRDTAHAERHQTLFTYRDAALAAGFVGLTFAMFPADEHFAQRLQNQDLQTVKTLDQAATKVEWITSPGAFYIGGGLYAFGRLAHHPDIADLGWHGTEAVIIASGITSLLKGTLGRSRPYVTSDTNPRDFGFGKGFSSSDRQSFPSGHTTTAFAAASAVTSEVRRMWPKYTWYVAPVMYGGATLVGLSRMYHDKHWASDVVLGAAVGTFSGLKTVRYSHAHADNPIDRVMLHATIAPDGHGGGYLGFTLPAP
ncbi:MAG: phosphoesterase PA-phosphatase related protein [Gemmatimonadetes bacterium]|nr:phosphoesterase PA-phosphatase related protein [Gemmatimonadota bacterium]